MSALKLKNEEVFSEDTSSLASFRKEASRELETLSRPNLKTETWKYTSTRWLEESDWSFSPSTDFDLSYLLEASEEKRNRLVFLDGVLREDLSFLEAQGVSVSSLEEVAEKKPELLKELSCQFSSEEKKYFPLLNESFLKEGSFIHVSSTSEKVSCDFTFLWSTEEKPKALFTKNFLLLEKNASFVVKETHRTLQRGSDALFSSSAFDVLVKEGASLRYKKIFHTAENHRHLAHLRASVLKEGSFKSFMVSLGAPTVRQDTLVRLAEEAAHTTLNGLYLSHEKNTTDFSFDIKHEAPRTTSHQYFKGFACDHSKGVFQGNITVSEEATLTRSRQLNKNLLLGQDAEIYTKPQLQIDTDDVKCSHGATVSQVREDELFYLQTRGLTREAATSFLIAAFFGELLEVEKQEDSDICEEEIKSTISKIIR